MQNKNKTFWPYGILISIFAIVCACIATIIFSTNYPVYEDEFYFDKYQNVKYNYEEIEKKQENFSKNYTLSYENPKYSFKDKKDRLVFMPDNNMNFKLLCLVDKCTNLKQAKITALLTRPHTSDNNANLQAVFINDNSFYVELKNLSKGRWQLKLKIELDEDNVGFFNFDLNTQKTDV